MSAATKPLDTLSASTERAPMRALLQSGYGSVDVLAMGETAPPRPGEGEVLIRVHGAGLDRGTWHLMTGRPYLMRVMGFGFSAPKNPVPGLDVAGVVVEVGAKVRRFRVGDAVFGVARGSFAELACAREDKLSIKPARLSFEEAAVLGISGMTAIQALTNGGSIEGQRVLVVGASGGVGSYAVQIAKALGATVTGVCSASKVERVRALGADEVIDYRARDFADGTTRYDLILDIGGNTPVARFRRAMTPTGRLVFVGGEGAGDWTGGFGRQILAMLTGLFVKQRFGMLMNEEHHRWLDRLTELVEQGELRPLIDRTIPIEEVPAAMRDLEQGRVTGKVAIRVR